MEKQGERKRYRRLKCKWMEWVPAKRIKALGEVCFFDRWGHEYRWAPLNEEVACLFSEMLRMELGKGHSAWTNVIRDLIIMAVIRLKEDEEQPEYPELVEELMDQVYLGEYLEERLPEDQHAEAMRKVRLGPREWHFMVCPQCNDSSRLIGLKNVQGGIEGRFKCWGCGYEFSDVKWD
jgi:hypothetical protein